MSEFRPSGVISHAPGRAVVVQHVEERHGVEGLRAEHAGAASSTLKRRTIRPRGWVPESVLP